MKFWQYAFLKNNQVSSTQCSLMLHFDGNLTDSSENAISVSTNGDAEISTDQSKFGGSSLYIPATGGTAYWAYNSVFDFNDGDFTIEFWYYPLSISQNAQIIGTTTNGGWGVYLYAEGFIDPRFGLGRNGYGFDIYSSRPISINTWHHFAISRKNGLVKLFIDGIVVASATVTNNMNAYEGLLRINSSLAETSSFSDSLNGYIDEVRVVKGLSIYNGPFNVPTQALSCPAPTPENNSTFENTLIYSMLDFNFIYPPSIDHNEPVYSE